MIRRFLAPFFALAAIIMAPAALASPVPYVTAPFDTVNNAVNTAIQNINAAVPTAAVLQVGTSSSGAVTINGVRGTITTESLSTAAGSAFTETLTNSSITAASQVFVMVGNGTNSAGTPALTTVVPAAGSAVIIVKNVHASAAFNGTLVISYLVVN